MALWTDVIDPQTLTGYARTSLEEYEKAKGSLSSFLPNQTVNDIVVRVITGQNGLVEAANFRAYDAELEPGVSEGISRKVIELPALGQWVPVSEYDQLRLRNASEDELLRSIQRTTDRVVSATSDRMEHMRGLVLATGKATIDQHNFKTEDDFGRDADLSVTAATKWNTDSFTGALKDLTTWADHYEEKNGDRPGTMLVSRKIYNALRDSISAQIKAGGGNGGLVRNEDVNAALVDEDLPSIQVYSRKVRFQGKTVNVLPDDSIIMLPSAGQSQLGASYWGRTLTSTEHSWGLSGLDQAGVVAGVYKNEKPPVIAQVFADAIGLPILANANLSMVAKVL